MRGRAEEEKKENGEHGDDVSNGAVHLLLRIFRPT